MLTSKPYRLDLTIAIALILILVFIPLLNQTVSKPQVLAVSNAIIEENKKLGTTAYLGTPEQLVEENRLFSEMIAQHREEDHSGGGLRSPALQDLSRWSDTRLIKGYAGKASINHGESIGFHVSTGTVTQPATAFSYFKIEIYRMGYYAGTGSTLVTTSPVFTAVNRGLPTPDPVTRMVAANWPTTWTLNTTTSWTSGAYLARAVATTASGSIYNAGAPIFGYMPFVVRNDSSTAAILFQLEYTTYQAYNNWGGHSLYDSNSNQLVAGGPRRAYKVSFDRPYELNRGSGYYFMGDHNMVMWLEQQGYDVTYATSVDVEQNPALMNNHQIFLSNYHDEYWSMNMRQNITTARDAGKHLAFFTSNNIYWQIRFENAADGRANRVIVCYKSAALDPMSTSATPQLTTVLWRDPPVNMPENGLLGVMYEGDFGDTIAFDWIVQNASHWVYAGTGLTNGSAIPRLIGDEYDRVFNNGLTPATLIKLSESPISATNGIQNGSIYTAASGACVFDASTNRWALYLYNTRQHPDAGKNMPPNPNIQRMTANILNGMLGGLCSSTIPTRTPTSTATSTATATATSSATSTATSTNTATATNTSTSTATNTPTATNTATETATATASATSSATNTATSTSTATATATSTSTATNTPTATNTATETATATASATSSATSTATSTSTATASATNTATATSTSTATNTPTATNTATETSTATASATSSATSTATASATNTATATSTSTATNTPTATNTATETSTSTNTPTATNTVTETATATASVTSTLTSTATSTATGTLVETSTPTSTPSETMTLSITFTPSSTSTETVTPTPSETLDPSITPTLTIVPSAATAVSLAPELQLEDPGLSKLGYLATGDLGLPGEQITWSITAFNRGAITINNVVVTDVIRDELRIDSVTMSRGTYTITGQTVIFNVGTLAPGESVTMQVITTVLRNPAANLFENDATLLTGRGTRRTAASVLPIIAVLPATGLPPAVAEQKVPLGWLWLVLVSALLASIAYRLYGQRR